METLPKQRLQIIVIVIIVLAVAAGFVFYSKRQGGVGGGGIVMVDPAQIPPGFADGVPLFYQTQVLQNYTTNVAGVTQATRQFVSSSTAPRVFKMYEDFFLKAGWNVSPNYHPKIASQQIFYATKGSDQATVIVDSASKTTNIDSFHCIVTLNFFTKTKLRPRPP
jgi:hypothetical protein